MIINYKETVGEYSFYSCPPGQKMKCFVCNNQTNYSVIAIITAAYKDFVQAKGRRVKNTRRPLTTIWYITHDLRFTCSETCREEYKLLPLLYP